jgi:hypothetical protein
MSDRQDPIEHWLAGACADADRRGLEDLRPLLESLAEATKALRSAGWEDAGLGPEIQRTETPEPPADGAAR